MKVSFCINCRKKLVTFVEFRWILCAYCAENLAVSYADLCFERFTVVKDPGERPRSGMGAIKKKEEIK